jgi:nitroimidazol reductase NimA-like FMN-containing flavoprotein (pyridoxamine 5'-phosphate oxidase superfamily)
MSEAPSDRATVRIHDDRAVYDRASIEDILDEGLVAHVGIADDHGPVVIPMSYGRQGDRLYLHGKPSSRLLRAVASGRPVSVTVTLVDGLVLARSVFHHSVNYRSVVIFGAGRLVRDDDAKLEALRVITEHIVPGRWADARLPNETELKQTYVVEIPLDEASAKVRTGPPKDDPADAELAVWGGVIPLELRADEPIPDSDLPAPAYAERYRRPGGGTGAG